MSDFAKWRTGGKLGRTIYRDEVRVGMLDTPEIAKEIVTALNVVPRMPREEGRHFVLVDAISRIAQHACRQGECGGRAWPHLYELPFRDSWRCVGDTYAPELMAALRAADIIGASHGETK